MYIRHQIPDKPLSLTSVKYSLSLEHFDTRYSFDPEGRNYTSEKRYKERKICKFVLINSERLCVCKLSK